MPTGSEIRATFIRYFVEHGHRHVHSSSLVPHADPTLLFTNAGMNQFKDAFLGLEKRDYARAATSQKCVRAGGKHNDLENVGFTKRHHTFFEMLGNFSFGDYFKQDAIRFAWELVTSKKWYGIAPERLYTTIFKGEQGVPRDDEAWKQWREQGVAEDRIFEMGMKDNFWQMGETGPCGPCSEIHYDMGAEASDLGHGVTAPECKFPCDCGRFVEIWNLVFMQFDRQPKIVERRISDGESDKVELAMGSTLETVLKPLPKPCVDTGMGLERVASVLQGVLSNYDTDLFQPLIKRAAELTGVDLKHELEREDRIGSRIAKSESESVALRTRGAASLRVIADHARATTFLITDGVVPSNEGRGYVLRKIMRRAIRHGRLLGCNDPFLFEMASTVVRNMGEAYPELHENEQRVRQTILHEERGFAHTLAIGMAKLDQLISQARAQRHDALLEYFGGMDVAAKEKIFPAFDAFMKGDEETRDRLRRELIKELGPSVVLALYDGLFREATTPAFIPGAELFKLYDTFGLPVDFIADALRDSNVAYDQASFDRAMAEQRERAKASWKGGAGKATASPAYREVKQTAFEGYKQTQSTDSEVLAIIHKGQGVRELRAGEEGEVVLDHTPFYAEAGGQVGDVGWLQEPGTARVIAEVKGCYYPVQGVRAHRVVAHDALVVGARVDAVVDAGVREQTMRNHTGTHLLHAALRQVLGTHVKQAGSLVDPAHLRFDFSHFAQIEDEQMQDIEDLVNREVLRNERVETVEDVPIDVAVNEYKAMALFGEKYGERVRVIRIGDFSTELCGGTHTRATGEIGLVKVLHEGSVSAGVRRVEAITGMGSVRHFRADHELEDVASSLWSGLQDSESVAEGLRRHMQDKDEEIKRLRKELEQARMKSAASAVRSIDDKVREVKGVKVLAHRADNLERAQLRTLVDNLRNKLGSGVVVLGSATDGKVALIVGVTKDLTDRVQAGKIVGAVAQKVGGKGGGRPDLAEAGGTDAGALDAALNSAYDVVASLLG